MTRLSLACLGLLFALPSFAAESLADATKGTPAITAIDAFRFSPGGLLLIGDARGSQVVVVDVGELKPAKWEAAKFEKIDEKLASRIGAPASAIEIKGLAVEPRSGTPFFNIKASTSKKPILLTMTGDGTISEFSLENVKHVVLPLPKAKDETVSRISDLAIADGRILVGAVSGAEFGSRVFSVPLDRKATGKGFSIETFHVSHNKWETRAPMTAMMPLKEKDGKQYIVGAYGCTPVVKYSLDQVQPDAKVKGESVIELGSGNQPRAMFAYEKDGKAYALMNTFRFHHAKTPFGWSPYWTVKMDLGLLAEHEKVNEKAFRRLTAENKTNPRATMVEEYMGVMLMDKLDAGRSMTLKKEKDDSLTLAVLPLP